MGFLIQNVEGGYVPAFEYLPASAITPKIGLALKLDTGTDKSEFISMTERDSAVTAGDIIPVIRVTEDITFAVPAQAAQTSVNIGTKVTLHTDGMQVTATATSGTAEIVGREGTAAGDIQYVRFR